MSPVRRIADRIAAAVMPCVVMYGVAVLTNGLGWEVRFVDAGLGAIAALVCLSLLPRVKLVTHAAVVPAAAVVVVPVLAACSGPITPLVPGAWWHAWWVPVAVIGVIALAMLAERGGRALLTAPAHARSAVPVVACAGVAIAIARIAIGAGSGADPDEVVRDLPIASRGDMRASGGTHDLDEESTLRWIADGWCQLSVTRAPSRSGPTGARPLPCAPFAVAELESAWIVAPLDRDTPLWRDGIAFSRTTLEPVAVLASDLPGPLSISPHLTATALAGCAIALAALGIAIALRLRARSVSGWREVVVDAAGFAAIDGAMVKSHPALRAGPALVAASRLPTGYRDGATTVRAISGTRDELLAALRARILGLELLAIAAALTGLAPLTPGYVVPSPF